MIVNQELRSENSILTVSSRQLQPEKEALLLMNQQLQAEKDAVVFANQNLHKDALLLGDAPPDHKFGEIVCAELGAAKSDQFLSCLFMGWPTSVNGAVELSRHGSVFSCWPTTLDALLALVGSLESCFKWLAGSMSTELMLQTEACAQQVISNDTLSFILFSCFMTGWCNMIIVWCCRWHGAMCSSFSEMRWAHQLHAPWRLARL